MANTNPILRVLIYLPDEPLKTSQLQQSMQHCADKVQEFLKTKIKLPKEICEHIAADSFFIHENDFWSVAAAYDHCRSCQLQISYADTYDVNEDN